jgi:phytoene/squalene synthetase
MRKMRQTLRCKRHNGSVVTALVVCDYAPAQISELREHLRHLDYGRYGASLVFFPKKIRPALWALLALHAEVMRAPFLSKEPLAVHIRLAWWRDALVAKPFVPSLHPLLFLLQPLIEAHVFTDDEWASLAMSPLALIDWNTPKDMDEFTQKACALYQPLMAMMLRIEGREVLIDGAMEALCVAQLLCTSMTFIKHGIQSIPKSVLAQVGVAEDDVVSGRAAMDDVRACSDIMTRYCVQSLASHKSALSISSVCAGLVAHVSYLFGRFEAQKERVLLDDKAIDARCIMSFFCSKLLRVFNV